MARWKLGYPLARASDYFSLDYSRNDISGEKRDMIDIFEVELMGQMAVWLKVCEEMRQMSNLVSKPLTSQLDRGSTSAIGEGQNGIGLLLLWAP